MIARLVDLPLVVSGAGSLDTFIPNWILVSNVVLLAACLMAWGSSGQTGSALANVLLRVPNALERVTRVPGWAVAMVGIVLFGVVTAGIGFYDDVAWHIALGRDTSILFTPPHTNILTGLAEIAAAAPIGVLFASLAQVNTRLRMGRIRIPWSAIPLALLGGTALTGFPLDNMWHAQYGIDVTMWSPTHLLMIVPASLAPLAAWLVLAEAGVRPKDGAWPRVLHVACAWLTLLGLSSFQGEYNYGVPQFQLLYHPVLLALAAGFAFTAIRLILGAGWSIGIASVVFASGFLLGGGDLLGGPISVRPSGLYVASALAVEIAAVAVGTRRVFRFSVLSAVGVATLGLAGEWEWNAHALQGWTSALWPAAFIFGGLAALGAAVVGAAFAGVIRGRRGGVPAVVALLGALAIGVALVIPLPRTVGSVSAAIHLVPSGNEVTVDARVHPDDAADNARWFQVLDYQGGGRQIADMQEVSPGRWVSSQPVSVTGATKSVLRLHKGGDIEAIPIRMPADPALGLPEIPAVDRTADFRSERNYLTREEKPGSPWLAYLVFGYDGLVGAAWIGALLLVAIQVRPSRRDSRKPGLASSRSGSAPDAKP